MRTCHAAKPIPEQTYAKCRTKCISPTHSSYFVEFLWKFDDSILRYGLLTVLSSVPSLTPSSGAWPKHLSHVFVDTFMNRSTAMRIWWIQATREKNSLVRQETSRGLSTRQISPSRWRLYGAISEIPRISLPPSLRSFVLSAAIIAVSNALSVRK